MPTDGPFEPFDLFLELNPTLNATSRVWTRYDPLWLDGVLAAAKASATPAAVAASVSASLDAVDEMATLAATTAATAVLEHALRVPETEPTIAPLPDALVRASKLLAFNSTGEPITTDTLNANIGVQSTGSSLVRTLASRFADVVNVKDFGAKGDGTTIDQAAVLQAVTLAVNMRRELYFPAGTYRLTSALIFDGGPMVVRGDGQAMSILRWDSNSPTVGLKAIQQDDQDIALVADLSLLTAGLTGTAIIVDCTAQIDVNGITLDRFSPRAMFRDVNMTGGSPGDVYASGWTNGIECIATEYVECVGCTFTGRLITYEPNVSFVPASQNGFLFRGSDPSPMGLTNGRPVVAILERCNINYCDTAIKFMGFEGCTASHCQIVAVNYGIVWSDSLGRPVMNVTDCHINTYGTCILATNICQLTVHGNSFYKAIDAAPTCYGIYIRAEGTPDFGHGYLTITDNQFQDSKAGTSAYQGIWVEAGKWGAIDNNVFRKVNTAIYLGTPTTGIRVGSGNVYPITAGFDEVAVRVHDDGTGNIVSMSTNANPGMIRGADGLEVKFGSSIVTLNASGAGFITFAPAFKSSLFTVVASSGDHLAAPNTQFVPVQDASNITGFTLVVQPNPGATTVRVNWVAYGV
jgi:hypothetical protein